MDYGDRALENAFVTFQWRSSLKNGKSIEPEVVVVEFSEAKTRENLAVVGLYKALGGGWH